MTSAQCLFCLFIEKFCSDVVPLSGRTVRLVVVDAVLFFGRYQIISGEVGVRRAHFVLQTCRHENGALNPPGEVFDVKVGEYVIHVVPRALGVCCQVRFK